MKKLTIDISRETLIERLESCYSLEQERLEVQVEVAESTYSDADQPPEELIKRLEDCTKEIDALRRYFESLADYLYSLGSFRTKEEARKAISVCEEWRREYLGPDGVVPDDGQLDPAEEADGILALMKDNDYQFLAPLARRYDDKKIDSSFAHANISARITSDHNSLTKLYSQDTTNFRSGDFTYGFNNWIWVEGKITGKNFVYMKRDVETFLQELQGALLAFEFVEYRQLPFFTPPPFTMGRGSTFNTGVYVNSISARLAPQLISVHKLSPTNQLDGYRSNDEIIENRLRLLRKAFDLTQDETKPVRQALRMFLRVFDSWSDGEKAMFLATTLEGLLLDKKNREDLSARLQEAVSFWLGGSNAHRSLIRERVGRLYKARSVFVHTGELSPKDFDVTETIDMTRKVILKEVSELS